MKTFGVTDYTNQTRSKHFTEKMSKFKTPKNEKKSRNVYKIGGAQLQCMNNHYEKFEYKKNENCWELQITQTSHHLLISDGKNI